MKHLRAARKSNRRQYTHTHDVKSGMAHGFCAMHMVFSNLTISKTDTSERVTGEYRTSVARKNAIKSPEYRWIKHQFTGDVMKYLFTRTDCCAAWIASCYCYGQYYFTSLTLTTPIENGWQDTTNCRQIPMNIFSTLFVTTFFFCIGSVGSRFFYYFFFVQMCALVRLIVFFSLCGHLLCAHIGEGRKYDMNSIDMNMSKYENDDGRTKTNDRMNAREWNREKKLRVLTNDVDIWWRKRFSLWCANQKFQPHFSSARAFTHLPLRFEISSH